MNDQERECAALAREIAKERGLSEAAARKVAAKLLAGVRAFARSWDEQAEAERPHTPPTA